MHIFKVGVAHTSYGPSYTSYVVEARSALDALAKVSRLTGPGEYAFEVQHVITLDGK